MNWEEKLMDHSQQKVDIKIKQASYEGLKYAWFDEIYVQ